MECFSAILLFDAFSARKRNRVVHWITVTAVAFLNATLLNFAATTMPNYSKIVIVLALFFSLHRLLYTSNGIFSLYISIIFYATICCMDNCWYTLLLLISEAQGNIVFGNSFFQSSLLHGVIIAVCFLQAKARIKSSNQFQMVHHSCSAFPCERFAYFLFRKLLSAGSNINSAAMCLCHIYYRNADSSVTFNQLDGTKRQLP